MELYRRTKLFEPAAVLRKKGFLVFCCGLENICLFAPKHSVGREMFKGCTAVFKKKVQLAVIATVIGLFVRTTIFKPENLLHSITSKFVEYYPKGIKYQRIDDLTGELLVWNTLYSLLDRRMFRLGKPKILDVFRGAVSALCAVEKDLFFVCQPDFGGIERLLDIQLPTNIFGELNQVPSNMENKDTTVVPKISPDPNNNVVTKAIPITTAQRASLEINQLIPQNRDACGPHEPTPFHTKSDEGDESSFIGELLSRLVSRAVAFARHIGNNAKKTSPNNGDHTLRSFSATRDSSRDKVVDVCPSNTFNPLNSSAEKVVYAQEDVHHADDEVQNSSNTDVVENMQEVQSEVVLSLAVDSTEGNTPTLVEAKMDANVLSDDNSLELILPAEAGAITTTVLSSASKAAAQPKIVGSSDESSPRAPSRKVKKRKHSKSWNKKSGLKKKSRLATELIRTNREECAFRCLQYSHVLNDWFLVIGVYTKEKEKPLFFVPKPADKPSVAFVDLNEFWKQGRTCNDALKQCVTEGLVFDVIVEIRGFVDKKALANEICVQDVQYAKRCDHILGTSNWDLFKKPKDIILMAATYEKKDSTLATASKDTNPRLTIWCHDDVEHFLREVFRDAVQKPCIFYDFKCSDLFIMKALCEDPNLIPLLHTFYRSLPFSYNSDYVRCYDYLRKRCLDRCDCVGHELLHDLQNDFSELEQGSTSAFYAQVGEDDEYGEFELRPHASLMLRKVSGGGKPAIGEADKDLCGKLADKSGARLEKGVYIPYSQLDEIRSSKRRTRPVLLYPKGLLVDAKTAMTDFREFISPFDMKEWFVAGITKKHLWYFMHNDSIGSLINTSSVEHENCVSLEENYRSVQDFRALAREGSSRFLRAWTGFIRVVMNTSRLRQRLQFGCSFKCSECEAVELFTKYGDNYCFQ